MATAPEPNAGGPWEPYSSAAEYFRHVPLLGKLAFFLIATVLAVGIPVALFNAMVELLGLCRRWRAHRGRVGQEGSGNASTSDPENVAPPALLVYSSATTKLAGAAPECAICLAEFADGDDVIRVMPACRHGFHAFCIERWLAVAGDHRSSCPTCRAPVAVATAAAAAAQPA